MCAMQISEPALPSWLDEDDYQGGGSAAPDGDEEDGDDGADFGVGDFDPEAFAEFAALSGVSLEEVDAEDDDPSGGRPPQSLLASMRSRRSPQWGRRTRATGRTCAIAVTIGYAEGVGARSAAGGTRRDDADDRDWDARRRPQPHHLGAHHSDESGLCLEKLGCHVDRGQVQRVP